MLEGIFDKGPAKLPYRLVRPLRWILILLLVTLFSSALTISLLVIKPKILLDRLSIITTSTANFRLNLSCGLGFELRDFEVRQTNLRIGRLSLCFKPKIIHGQLKLLTTKVANVSFYESKAPLDHSAPGEAGIQMAAIIDFSRSLSRIHSTIEISDVQLDLQPDLQMQVQSLTLRSLGGDRTQWNSQIRVNKSSPINIHVNVLNQKKALSIESVSIEGNDLDVTLPSRFFDSHYDRFKNAKVHSLELSGSGIIQSNHMSVSLDKVLLNSDLGRTTGKATFKWSDGQSVYEIDLDAQDLTRGILGVIPPKVMGSETYGWLAENLHHATCLSGMITIKGRNENLESLLINLDCQDGSIGISPNWPELTAKDMTVSVTEKSVSIKSPAINIGLLEGKDVNVSVPNFYENKLNLLVDAKIEQNLAEISKGLEKSPLAFIDQKLQELPWYVSGLMNGQLGLMIPLEDHSDPTVTFKGTISRGRITAKSELLPAADEIAAQVAFEKKKLIVNTFSGRILWSHGLRESVTVGFKGNGYANISGNQSTYQFNVDLLPESIDVDSGSMSKFIRNNLNEASATISGTPLELRMISTINQEIKNNLVWNFDSNDWGATVSNKTLGDVTLGSITFDVPWAQGSAKFNRQDLVEGNFENIELPDLFPAMNAEGNQPSPINATNGPSPLDPRTFPSFAMNVKKLSVGWREFGEVRINIEKTTQGLKLNRFSIEQGPCSQFNTTGSWFIGAESHSHLKIMGHIYCRDVGKSFRMLKAPAWVHGFAGNLDYHLSWYNPSQNTLQNLVLKTKGHFNNGRILIAKSGVLKAIELLTLNMRDSLSQNFEIKEITFDATKEGALSKLHNIKVKSPSYVLNLEGAYDVSAQIIDASVHVRFNISGILGKAASIAINPLYADEILNTDSPIHIETLDNVAKYSFKFKQSLSSDQKSM